MEREDTETVPSPLGYYHYPETMSDKEAVQRLGEELILTKDMI